MSNWGRFFFGHFYVNLHAFYKIYNIKISHIYFNTIDLHKNVPKRNVPNWTLKEEI